MPIYNLLEGHFELVVANAAHMKAVPGRKSDVQDGEWSAELLRHEKHLRRRQNSLRKYAASLGFELVPIQNLAHSVS